mgnify:CR=1 FL=1
MIASIWFCCLTLPVEDLGPRPHVVLRGLYGGVPDRLEQLEDLAINAVWVGSGGLNAERIAAWKARGAKVFAEFNTMHESAFLKASPDAAPIGADGKPSPPPDGWQGICPTHPGYREARMAAFRKALEDFEIDGIWLDYHHAQASWEQAEPNLPDTCFCDRCLMRFEKETGKRVPGSDTPTKARALLGPLLNDWTEWRCGVFVNWVAEFKTIRDEVRPRALLGTFHCPWSDTDRGNALKTKLAIDLKAQARYLDVLSPMPYHARFGHAADPAWVSRQTKWLGGFLGLEGKPGERLKIWPIVQLADWGEPVPASQTNAVIDHGTRPPATGVMVFHAGGVGQSPEKVESLRAAYRAIQPVRDGGPDE